MSETLKFHLRKFFKYAMLLGSVDALFVFIQALSDATGLTSVDWFGCADKAGLVFIKASLAGGLGILSNLVNAQKAALLSEGVLAEEKKP